MSNGIPLPDRGRLTFDAEGVEQRDSPYFSRVFHVPTASSGLTIGRGYDMKLRSGAAIRGDLGKAGIAQENATLISDAAGLAGDAAKAFVTRNGLQSFEITGQQQLVLFEITYGELETDAERLATKADVTEAYGATDWAALDPTIKDVVVDLRFRGDYTPDSRRFLQTTIAANDLRAFSGKIGDRSLWPSVPEDRFNRRKAYCDQALATA